MLHDTPPCNRHVRPEKSEVLWAAALRLVKACIQRASTGKRARQPFQPVDESPCPWRLPFLQEAKCLQGINLAAKRGCAGEALALYRLLRQLRGKPVPPLTSSTILSLMAGQDGWELLVRRRHAAREAARRQEERQREERRREEQRREEQRQEERRQAERRQPSQRGRHSRLMRQWEEWGEEGLRNPPVAAAHSSLARGQHHQIQQQELQEQQEQQEQQRQQEQQERQDVDPDGWLTCQIPYAAIDRAAIREASRNPAGEPALPLQECCRVPPSKSVGKME
jgi:hypothetical protein